MKEKAVSRVKTTKKTQKKTPKKVGRKSKYTKEVVEKICKIIAEGGIDKAAYEAVGITYDTFYKWVAEKTEFAEAVKKAREQFREWKDKECIKQAEHSLVRLIMGEEYIETTTEFGLDENNKPIQKKQKQVTKKILPNVTAIIFALTNRDSERWKNRLSQEVRGKVESEQKTNISLANVPDDLLIKVVSYIRGE